MGYLQKANANSRLLFFTAWKRQKTTFLHNKNKQALKLLHKPNPTPPLCAMTVLLQPLDVMEDHRGGAKNFHEQNNIITSPLQYKESQ